MINWSAVSNFASTVWGKVLIVLTIVSLLGGIVAETVSARAALSTAEIARYQAEYAGISQKAEADAKTYTAAVKEQEAANARLQSQSEAREADYKAEVARQQALNATVRERAESDLKRAEADAQSAKSEYRRQQLDGEAETIEQQTRQLKVGIKILQHDLARCSYCKGRDASCFSECAYNDMMNSVIGR